MKKNSVMKKGSITDDIEKLKQRRDDRKHKNYSNDGKGGNPQNEINKACDADYEKLMKKKKIEFDQEPNEFVSSENSKLFVIVRKRPVSKKEMANGEIDCVSIINPTINVHECKIKIDGITKYIEDHEFYFDNAFSERKSTEDVYRYTIHPLINLIMSKGIVTCFAYGQTGSGKTHTMKGIQNLAIDSLFRASLHNPNKKYDFYISFFEIYGGRLFDLCNNKNKLTVLEDKNQKVQIFGLEEKIARDPEEMRSIIDYANSIRTTHNTVTNETSSRSHAICNIIVKEQNSEEQLGKLTLVDLAGSERAQETQSNDRQRRAEGAEINKSLLALKECIRALDARKSGAETHVPFRASKLTQVLRDSFISKSDKSRIVMISCVGPGFSSANHTINTLRYADRLKEKTSQMNRNIQNNKLNNVNFKEPNIKEVGDFNMQVIRMDDNNFNNMDFDDDMIVDDKYLTPEKQEQNDWEYLKKTVNKEGKFLSDDFIKYHQITDLLVEDEDNIINNHMSIIKDEAKMLTEEGELITQIKGLSDDTDLKMDEYAARLEKIINKKIFIYNDLKKKIDIYKKHVKEEDDIRSRINPKFFLDN